MNLSGIPGQMCSYGHSLHEIAKLKYFGILVRVEDSTACEKLYSNALHPFAANRTLNVNSFSMVSVLEGYLWLAVLEAYLNLPHGPSRCGHPC